ncbi:AUX/IAA family [Musa troglodytarum]|uniref:Auxin-responsive protein n=1 Tax=Musa troglodytarum TaxID=320322 RepID=A0A9E7FBF4_9LILI|nr:AUX/IAA family [Musa troglodytarum]URD92107.1 AUX/IAA family [Musa troglodytarum]
MEEDLENRGGACPQLLDLIPNESDWMMAPEASGEGRGVGGLDDSEDKKLELKLGLPGGGAEEAAVLSLGFFSKASKTTTTTCAGARRGLFESAESKSEGPRQEQQAGFLQLQSRAESGNEWPHKAVWAGGKADLQQSHAAPGGAAGPNTSSQTRAAPAPVVGWPPLRSFRKNLSNSSVKPSVELQNDNVEMKQKFDNNKKGLLVKINMDGIPIGRKVDLKTYDNYEKLSLAVKELFLGLLAAQKDTPENENEEAKQAFVGLLDGSREYTLVYEDNEGDKMLVGDVPWDMFVSTVKRLRVLKSSDLAALRLGAVSRKRTATES